MLREREPKGPDAEAREEERESAVPGARGKEYSAIEREGDRGQPRKHGGGIGMHGHREHEQHHGKHHGNMHHRARGGYMPEETNASDDGMAAGHEDMPKKAAREGTEKYRDVANKTDKAAHEVRKRGGRMKRRAGGHVHGHEPNARVDRRARGGKTSDLSPMTAAGNMSVPAYERQQTKANGGGEGNDNCGPRSDRG